MKAWGSRLITGQARGIGAGLLRGGLTVASWGYGLGVRLARGLYDTRLRRPHRLACPVVSIGNLTWGGTGKTPLTAHLARWLQQRGVRVAILTRGYGGDEPMVLRRLAAGVPVLVGADRVVSGRQAVASGAEALLLDDGFQHWRVHRDLDIVLIDATAPFGNGALLPRGPLREPVSHLRRAGVVVITKADGPQADVERVSAQVHAVHPEALVVTARYRPERFELWPAGTSQPLTALGGGRACVLSGIADPAAFEALVTRVGVVPVLTRRFVDHHPYCASDLEEVVSASREAGAAWIVTTLKDAVRFPPGRPAGTGIPIAVLHVTMELDGEAALLRRLSAVYGC